MDIRCRPFIAFALLLSITIIPRVSGAQVQHLKPEQIKSVELLIATPSRASMASVAGHLYIVFYFKNETKSSPLVMGFEADTRADDEKGVSTLLFSMRGLFGHYRTMIDFEPLERVVFRSTIVQDRSLYRLRLRLTRGQVRNLVDHVSRFQKLKRRERYYFLNQNCTTYIRWLINQVLNREERIIDLDVVDLPLNVAKKLFQRGVGAFVYPEYWSISRRFYFAQKQNHRLMEEMEILFVKHPRFTFLPAMVDICRKLEYLTNPLGRGLLYENLYQRFSTLFDDHSIHLKYRKSLYHIMGEIFFNYRDMERFLAYRRVKDKDGLRRLADLNSTNVIYLSRAINKCQLHFSLAGAGLWASMLNSLENRRSTAAKTSRLASLSLPAFSLANLNLGTLNQRGEGSNQLSLSLKYMLMGQRMGDRSLFAHNRSTGIELFSISWTSYAPSWQSLDLVLLEFEKVISASRLNYHGFLNSGYGFSFFKLTTHPHPQVQSHLKLVDGRFVLGLFEAGGFRHFLNLSSGIGLSLSHLDSGEQYHGLNSLLKLEGKVQLGSRGLRELRIKSELNHTLNFKEFSFTRFNTEVEVGVPLGKRSGILLRAGARWYHSYLKYTDAPGRKHHFFSLYTGLLFSTDRLIQLFL